MKRSHIATEQEEWDNNDNGSSGNLAKLSEVTEAFLEIVFSSV